MTVRNVLLAAMIVTACRAAEPPAPNNVRPVVTIQKIHGSNPIEVTGISTVQRELNLRVSDQYGDVMDTAPLAPVRDERAAGGTFHNEIVLTRDPGTFVVVEVIDPAEPVQPALARATATGSTDVVPRVLFFPNAKRAAGDCAGVAAVERRIPRSEEVARVLVKALLEGPTELERLSGFTSPFPPGTTLRSARTEAGVVTVDFQGRAGLAESACAREAVHRAVEQTLLALPAVTSVKVLHDGNELRRGQH
jgi:hypothetical protein